MNSYDAEDFISKNLPAIVAAISALIIGGAVWLDILSCHARWSGSGLASKWGVLEGCRVRDPILGWIPENNYRSMD